jgi:hypothetical protein
MEDCVEGVAGARFGDRKPSVLGVELCQVPDFIEVGFDIGYGLPKRGTDRAMRMQQVRRCPGCPRSAWGFVTTSHQYDILR